MTGEIPIESGRRCNDCNRPIVLQHIDMLGCACSMWGWEDDTPMPECWD